METGDKYTILLPTYNERENLPIAIWLIFKYMKERWFWKSVCFVLLAIYWNFVLWAWHLLVLYLRQVGTSVLWPQLWLFYRWNSWGIAGMHGKPIFVFRIFCKLI